MTTASHKAYRTLLSGGFTEQQADALIDIVQDSSDQHVTKEQLDTALDARLSKQKSELVMWLAALMIAQFAGQIGVMLALIKFLKGA
jgi:cytochrome P450